MNPSYLVRQQSSWCFRIRVPDDLQLLISRKELRYSLKTGSVGEAKYLARRAAGLVQWIFMKLRKDFKMAEKLTDDQIQEIIRKSIKQALEDEEEYILMKKPLKEDEYLDWLAEPQMFAYDNRVALALGDYNKAERSVGY